ncbi:MAG: hypothetical protein WCJ18_04515, partial [Planctomycetota bacterium]
MRLTVRTLLAWLDNVLPPDEQKQLGDKVLGSAAAQQLVDRIRRVMERPTISAPRVEGKGLAADANTVAEYLDNTLESDKLETFERICVESDMYLAEVAACHNLLAAASADPAVSASLDAPGRKRLLAAMQHRSAVLFAEAERRESVANARAVQAALRTATPEHDDTVLFDKSRHPMPLPSSDGAPVTPRRRTAVTAWAAAVTALALLLVLGGLLVQSIMSSRGRKLAAREEPRAVAPAATDAIAKPAAPIAAEVVAEAEPVAPVVEEARGAPAAEPPAPQKAATEPVTEPVAEPVTERVAESAVPAAPAVAAAPVMPATPATTDLPVTPAPPPAPTESPRVPFGDALAIAAPAPPAPAGAVAPEPPASATAPLPASASASASPFDRPALPAAVEPAAPQPAVGFVGTEGLLLHKVVEAGQSAWAPFAAGAALGLREELLAPAGAHPDVNIHGVRIRLLPGRRATVSLDPDGTPRLAIAFGRAVARASSGAARLGVTADGLTGTIMAGLTEPVAISVELERFAGADPASQPARVRAGILAAAGGIVWRQSAGPDGMLAGIAPEGMLEARTAINWDSFRPTAAALERLPSLPDWVAAAPPTDRLEKAARDSLAAKVAAVAPLDRALRELATDRRVENRMLAVSTLALLGEFEDLVELLCADAPGRKLEGRQWLQLEAATVPLALARGALAAGKLREAFANRGPHGKAEVLDAMARGFTNEELAAGADQALVTALDDD